MIRQPIDVFCDRSFCPAHTKATAIVNVAEVGYVHLRYREVKFPKDAHGRETGWDFDEVDQVATCPTCAKSKPEWCQSVFVLTSGAKQKCVLPSGHEGDHDNGLDGEESTRWENQ